MGAVSGWGGAGRSIRSGVTVEKECLVNQADDWQTGSATVLREQFVAIRVVV